MTIVIDIGPHLVEMLNAAGGVIVALVAVYVMAKMYL